MFELIICSMLTILPDYLYRRYGRNQLVGPRNSRPAPKVAKAVDTFLEEINNRVRVATTVGAVD